MKRDAKTMENAHPEHSNLDLLPHLSLASICDIKSDERILGESDFVDDILSQTSEKFERHYELKLLGYVGL